MLKEFRKIGFLFYLTSGLVLANNLPEKTIKENLLKQFPQLEKIDEIKKIPVAGLYEVIVDNNIFYTDKLGRYIIQGEILDSKTKKNLTAERSNKLNKIEFNKLPFQDAIKIVNGKGERKMVVFQDPNCSYCRKFETSLKDVDNLTIYLFLYPILGENSTEKAKNVWCSKNKAKSWRDMMINNKNPAKNNCDTQVINRNLALGRQHKITGTPTIIFANNTRISGIISPEEIEENL